MTASDSSACCAVSSAHFDCQFVLCLLFEINMSRFISDTKTCVPISRRKVFAAYLGRCHILIDFFLIDVFVVVVVVCVFRHNRRCLRLESHRSSTINIICLKYFV